MGNYIVNINERMTSGKMFLEIMPEKEKYPYNRKVVKELVKSRKTKGITIDRKDFWK